MTEELKDAERGAFENCLNAGTFDVDRVSDFHDFEIEAAWRGWQARAALTQPAQSPGGRTIDKAMVKRLAIQHGLLTGWQPIETAPKDGTRFIAWHEGRSGFFHWQGNDGTNRPVGWRDDFIYVYPEGDLNGPTHWQPLPEAPNGAKP
jgi:hypothetical protein